jgi:hypothetical protein
VLQLYLTYPTNGAVGVNRKERMVKIPIAQPHHLNSMKTLIIIAAIALSGCAGHSITYNGTFGRYTIDRKGHVYVETYQLPEEEK